MTSELARKEKKFHRHFLMHITMFLAVLALSVVVNENNDLSAINKGYLAITPVIPLIFLLRLIITYYRTLDEYIQSVMGESLLWAVSIVGCCVMAYGLLAEMVEVPSINLAFMLPALGIVFGIAQFIQLLGDTHEE